jgi:general L-amino acid transport system substrate-binding protein
MHFAGTFYYDGQSFMVPRSSTARRSEDLADAAMRAFFDQDGRYGKAIGIDPNWVVRTIETVGNYGEMFERNLGGGSPLKLERGFNRLWTQGGLMYAPPFR